MGYVAIRNNQSITYSLVLDAAYKPFRVPGLESGLLRFLGAFLPHRFAAEFDAKGIVDQSVENAVGDGGIADLLMPVK
jgi:hypothetical protein